MGDYCVYIHQNRINGKVYVGMTSNANKRWSGRRKYSNQLFGEAIEKYGWNNFNHVIVADGLTEEQASDIEKEYIKQYDSMNPEHGYNQNSGGKNNWRISDAARKRLIDSHIEFFKDPQNRKEQGDRLIRYYEKHPELRKPVVQYRKDGAFVCEYGSAWETGRHGFDASHVKACCKGYRKTANGYIWRYKNES
jgi:predicted GIY-YIG superfamily endonuclease